jgi:hypothetical protein
MLLLKTKLLGVPELPLLNAKALPLHFFIQFKNDCNPIIAKTGNITLKLLVSKKQLETYYTLESIKKSVNAGNFSQEYQSSNILKEIRTLFFVRQ